VKYIKFAFSEIAEKLGLSIMLILQATLLISAINFTLASYNTRDMLYAPYEDLINKQGFILSESEYLTQDENNKDYWHTHYEFAENISPKFKGDVEIYFQQEYSDIDDNGNPFTIVIIPDEVYDKFKLPLTNGNYDSAIIVPNKYGFTVGDKIGGMEISGILTDPTYFPSLNSFSADADIRDLYNNTALSFSDDTIYVITSKSEFEKTGIEDNLTREVTIFAYYTTPVSEEIYKEDKKLILENNMWCTEISEFKEQNDKYMNENLFKYIPLIILVFVVSMIGLIGTTAINVLSQLKNYAVFFLCGARWKKCVKICIYNVGIKLFAATLLSALLFTVAYLTGMFEKYGLMLNMYNVIATFGTVIIAVLFSIIIPYLIILKKSPVDILRNTKS
jgi:ABC-type antimicrobial peptide transport system permease subunit